MIVAGLGFTTKATESDILRAVHAALAGHGLSAGDLGLIASIEEKRASDPLAASAHQLNVPIKIADARALEEVSGALMTHSEKSLETTGSPSASEAAALACAGSGGALLGPRIIEGPVTCALAKTADTGNSGLEEEKP